MSAHAFHPIADVFPLMEGDELRALAEDIRANGLHEPIWLHPDGRVVDGRNRLRACGLSGVQPRFRTWNEAEHGALLPFVISLNVRRRHLDESQRAMVAARLATLKQGEKKSDTASAVSQPEAAKLLKVSPDSIQRARRVLDEGTSALVDACDRGVVTVSDAARITRLKPDAQEQAVADVESGGAKTLAHATRRASKAEAVAAIQREPVLEGGPYRVVVLDPPWRYDLDSEFHRASPPYPTMTLDEIKALPIPSLACPDAVVWLWTTNAFMREAYEMADAWGFEAKTILTWVKPRFGMGIWLRGQTEHCLLLVRGHPVVTLTSQSTALNGPVREHSRKPDEFYALVESLCPGSKVELFARETRKGWASWGAEKTKFDSSSGRSA